MPALEDISVQTIKKEVLLIDDDFDTRRTTRDVLHAFGYAVTDVSSGEEGIAILKESPQKYAFALIDKNMPGLDGHQTIDFIRLFDNSTKLMLYTGKPEPVDLDFLQQGKIQGYITKPYKLNELMESIDTMLSKKSDC